MCFSATASFTLSTLLISIGTCSAIKGFKANKDYLLFSLIPIFLGAQQSIEGLIWCQLNANDTLSNAIYIDTYLFFAFYFWLFYIPLSTYFIEKNIMRKNIIFVFVLAGLILGVLMYAPILFNIIPTKVNIISHSIRYGTYAWGPVLWTYTSCYIFILLTPLLITTVQKIRIFGLMLLISAAISYWWYSYAFTSIWCFFSAILSIYTMYIVYKSPNNNLHK